MPGPNKDTEVQKYQKRVRTGAWLSKLIFESGATSANHLALMMEEKVPLLDTESGPKDNGTRWMNFCAEGKPKSPGPKTLQHAECLIPNSMNVYEDGPENSFIYKLIWDSADDIILFFNQNPLFKWVNDKIPNGSLYRTDENDWKCLIGCLHQMFDMCDTVTFSAQNMTASEVNWWQTNGNSFWWKNPKHPNHLQLFSATLGILKIAVEREKHAYNPHLPDLFELAFCAFNEAGVKVSLAHYNLSAATSKVLHELIWNYALISLPKNQTESKLCELSWLPSYENFINQPMKYLDKIVQGRIFQTEASDTGSDVHLDIYKDFGTTHLEKLYVDNLDGKVQFFSKS